MCDNSRRGLVTSAALELPPLSRPLKGQTALCGVQGSAQEVLSDSRGGCCRPGGHSWPCPGPAPSLPPVRSVGRLWGTRSGRLSPGLAFPLHTVFIYMYKFLSAPLHHPLLQEKRKERGRKGEILFELTKGGIWCTLRLASVLLVSPAARSHRGQGQEGPACICWAPQ